MHWVPDRTGRFRWRPYYRAEEIDSLCDEHVRRFLQMRYGDVTYPVTTDDLTRLIEQEVDELDLYADLSDVGVARANVEGVTIFIAGARPRVRIAAALSLDSGRELRLRTTLAHELGHVLLHNFVGEGPDGVDPLGDGATESVSIAPPFVPPQPGQPSWMEWQASYACGALLMPHTALHILLNAGRPAYDPEIAELADVHVSIQAVQNRFFVSESAARVRLRQIGLPTARGPPMAYPPLTG